MRQLMYNDKTRVCRSCMSPACSNASCPTCKQCRNPACRGKQICQQPLFILNTKNIPKSKLELSLFCCSTCAFQCQKCGQMGAARFTKKMRTAAHAQPARPAGHKAERITNEKVPYAKSKKGLVTQTNTDKHEAYNAR